MRDVLLVLLGYVLGMGGMIVAQYVGERFREQREERQAALFFKSMAASAAKMGPDKAPLNDPKDPSFRRGSPDRGPTGSAS